MIRTSAARWAAISKNKKIRVYNDAVVEFFGYSDLAKELYDEADIEAATIVE